MKPERVWYVAYGSNLDGDRFQRYLSGGETEPGARDPSRPRSSAWAAAPLRLCFARESVRWNGGGVAFVDPDRDSEAIVRLWDISADQFEDVFAQENRLAVPTALDWTSMLGSEDLTVGNGWYCRLLRLDLGPASAQQPALTFTWSDASEHRAPHADYLATIRSGLAEHPDLSPTKIDRYLTEATIG